MRIIKEIGLVLYLVPLWGVLFILDRISRAGKFVYKIFHAAGCVVSRHVEAVMMRNGL